MAQLRKRIFVTAGYNSVSMGPGRKEFDPKAKDRPGIEHWIFEAGRGALAGVAHPEAIDEGVISNFMAARFCHQGNLAGFVPAIHPSLMYKPVTRVEGACGSGGMAILTGAKAVLAEVAESVLVVGAEVQNTVKSIYGADYLAGAGHYSAERKNGHAFFFPSKFSERAGAYFAKYERDATRKGMASWYAQMVQNARTDPNAQEHHNKIEDLVAAALAPPRPDSFVEHLNVFDCSKVSDGGSALIVASEEGLKRLGVRREDAVELVAFGQAEGDITAAPSDLTEVATTKNAVAKAFANAGIGKGDLGLLELHDCFTITAVLALEAVGVAARGKGAAAILEGKTRRDGELPTNLSGGLIGYGHYVGGTGVRQAVDILRQLTGKAGGSQVKVKKPHGLMISMGGDDKTVSAIAFRQVS